MTAGTEPHGRSDADQAQRKRDWDDSQDDLLSSFCLIVLGDKMGTGPCSQCMQI